jgi:hypothetical protein
VTREARVSDNFVGVILQGPACGPHVPYLGPEAVKVAVAEAVAAEREACAAVADAAADRNWHGDGSRAAPEEIAADIRARGEAPRLTPGWRQALRDAGGDGWDAVDDPEAYLGRKDDPGPAGAA